MLKQLLVATALTCGAATAFAQSPSGSPPAAAILRRRRP